MVVLSVVWGASCCGRAHCILQRRQKTQLVPCENRLSVGGRAGLGPPDLLQAQPQCRLRVAERVCQPRHVSIGRSVPPQDCFGSAQPELVARRPARSFDRLQRQRQHLVCRLGGHHHACKGGATVWHISTHVCPDTRPRSADVTRKLSPCLDGRPTTSCAANAAIRGEGTIKPAPCGWRCSKSVDRHGCPSLMKVAPRRAWLCCNTSGSPWGASSLRSPVPDYCRHPSASDDMRATKL